MSHYGYYRVQVPTATSATLTTGGTYDLTTGGTYDTDSSASWTYNGTWTTSSPWITTGGSVTSSSTTYTGYSTPYFNMEKLREVMRMLHPDPAWSDWAVLLWKDRQQELQPTSSLHVLRATTAPRLYFVQYAGTLLVAAKSLRTARRCVTVLSLNHF